MRQFSIGIDLGTTNCVVAYTRLDAEQPELKLLGIPQITAPGETETLDSLPNFLYVPTEQEAASGAFDLPDAGRLPDGGRHVRTQQLRGTARAYDLRFEELAVPRRRRSAFTNPALGFG